MASNGGLLTAIKDDLPCMIGDMKRLLPVVKLLLNQMNEIAPEFLGSIGAVRGWKTTAVVTIITSTSAATAISAGYIAYLVRKNCAVKNGADGGGSGSTQASSS